MLPVAYNSEVLDIFETFENIIKHSVELPTGYKTLCRATYWKGARFGNLHWT
jgi:hypothetical protein